MSREQHLVQLNVEGGRLRDSILQFLTHFPLAIFCTQEMIDSFFQLIQREAGMKGEFFPMAYLPKGHGHPRLIPNGSGEIGIAILTPYPIVHTTTHIFSNNQTVDAVKDAHLHNVGRRALLRVTIQYGNRPLTIGTTHFMVTNEGEDHPQQIEEYMEFMRILTKYPVDAWAGDTNAPQKNTVHEMIRQDFDVGKHGLISTLTAEHRVPSLQYLERDVDVIAVPKIVPERDRVINMNLRYNSTLSDHTALIATLCA